MAEPQSFKNHARFDPKFHFFAIPLALLCFIAAIFHYWKQHTPVNMLLIPVTFLLVLIALIARMYALQVQDRVIRLEETLRMQSMGYVPVGLTTKQFVALRFAADAEVVGLAQRAAGEKMEPKAIKEAIVTWRPDHDRV